MVSKIYFNHNEGALLITSNFAEIQKRIDLKMDPKVDYEELNISSLSQYKFDKIAFDGLENDYFQKIRNAFTAYKYEFIAFRNSSADLVLDVQHLVIGDKSKISLSSKNFKNLKEITFLSLKTFKERVLDKISSIHRLTLWYANHKSNELLDLFPGLEKLSVFNGGLEIIDLTKNPMIKHLDLHRCLKLTEVKLNPSTQLQSFMVEACKKLSPVDFHKIHSDE